ncbi:MAG TPA: GFA family protein [Caulobacteraceae bacterium]|jgi:hypothetical protein
MRKPRDPDAPAKPKLGKAPVETTTGACACGGVTIEIDLPAFWAWHDHSAATRKASAGPYATWIGCWKKKVRIAAAENLVSCYRDEAAGTSRSFCARCGSPLMYERPRSGGMVNLARNLFPGRTGREPRYHIALDQAAEWLWQGEPLAPLKGYPGVMWERPKRRRKHAPVQGMF